MRSVASTLKYLFVLLLVISESSYSAIDTAYINGKVITVDKNFSIAQAFSIQDGKFGTVGTTASVLASVEKDTHIIDLKGKTVIPGLIDNHNHFIRGASHWSTNLRLDGIDSRSVALQLLKEHAASLPADAWIYVLGGWNEEQFKDDPRGFTLDELDELSGNRPVFLQAQYDHAFVNSTFLDLIDANIHNPNPDTPASNNAVDKKLGPPLSQLVVRNSKGQATSKLIGGMGMVLQVSTLMPKLEPNAISNGILSAQRDYNALGLTTVYDPGGSLISQSAIEEIEYLRDKHQLTLRIYRTQLLSNLSPEMITRIMSLRWLPSWLTEIVMSLVKDTESTGDSIQTVAELPNQAGDDDFYDLLAIGELIYIPMHDSMHYDPANLTDDRLEQLHNLLAAIIERNLSIQIHAITREVIGAYLDIIEDISKTHSLANNQIQFTHAEEVTPEQLERIKALGITIQTRSMSLVRSRDSLISEIDQSVLEMPPLRTIQDSGVTWGLGTDGTKAAQINPMLTLYWAVSGRSINGDQVIREQQLISREQALIAHTRSNAALVNRSHSLGQISPDYYADFVILDRDYLTVDVEDIKAIQVDQTVVSGKVVYQK